MKKWLLCLAAVAAVGALDLWPFPQQDAGELYLVETLLVEADGRQVTLRSGELSGSGGTSAEALEEMEQRAPGQLFLRQTRRIIFCNGAERFCDPMELPEPLPMGACVYCCPEAAKDLEEKKLNQVLEARERRNERTPTLAQMKNSVVSGVQPDLAPIEEGVYENA